MRIAFINNPDNQAAAKVIKRKKADEVQSFIAEFIADHNSKFIKSKKAPAVNRRLY